MINFVFHIQFILKNKVPQINCVVKFHVKINIILWKENIRIYPNIRIYFYWHVHVWKNIPLIA